MEEAGSRLPKLVQETHYPEEETSAIRLELKRDMEFLLKFRVPTWAQGMTFKVNGAAQQVAARPGTWAEIKRTWKTGDTLEIRIPLRFRKSVIDPQHSGRAAVMCGPLVLAQEAPAGSAIPTLPAEDQLGKWLAAADTPGIFRAATAPGGSTSAPFKPFYLYGKDEPYRVYFDPA